jgi:hypothetical protein
MTTITDAMAEAALAAYEVVEPGMVRKHFPKDHIAWKFMRAALEAAERAAWRPIEEAPKDVWLIGSDGKQSAPMRWVNECGDEVYTGWCGADYVGGGTLFYGHVPPDFEPTRFQPLPPPPEGDGK